MRVLIVGANGYIGAKLTPYIAANAVDLDHDVEFAIKHHDTIIYLAGMSNNDMCERNPELARRLNEEPFDSVLKASKGKRFIFASSVAAYGNCEDTREDRPLNPTTLYGQSKKFCEEALKASDLDYTIIRCASVCGYSPRMRYDLMVNKMTRDAAKTGKISVHGGTQQRSHVHINDVCRFYAWILNNWKSRETYNLVAENMSVMKTAWLVGKTIGKTETIFTDATDNRSYTINGDKTRKAGFECKSTIEDAIVSIYLNTLYS